MSHVYPVEDRGFWPLLVDVAEAAGYPNMLSSHGADASDLTSEEMVSPYSGEVWRIVRSLERRAEDAGLTTDEERAMIERALENAERQAELMFDAELARRDRDPTEDET